MLQNLKFCNTLIFFIFKYNYLQLNTSLTEKSTIFPRIFTFPQTISLSNTKKSVMRGRAFIGLALRNIPRNHGWIAFPPYPLARIAATSSARLRTILTLERAHTRPYTAWRKRQAALRCRVPSAHLRSASRNLSARFAGMYPANYPPLRSRPTPALRGCAAGAVG